MKGQIKTYALWALSGAIAGIFILHPFSMVFQKVAHPDFIWDFTRVRFAFNPHHLPMAGYFGLLGMGLGLMNAFYLLTLKGMRSRVKSLEDLLPICSYCKKIRDDQGHIGKQGAWYKVEHYLHQTVRTDFTHGICPDCYSQLERELEAEDHKNHSHAFSHSHHAHS